jgi:hypothetical protein
VLLEGTEPAPIPTRIGATDIEQIRDATRVFESWSGTYGGGGLAQEAVMGQLRWSAGLLGATCPDRLRPELHSALGGLAEVAGYLAVDAKADEQARRVSASRWPAPRRPVTGRCAARSCRAWRTWRPGLGTLMRVSRWPSRVSSALIG